MVARFFKFFMINLNYTICPYAPILYYKKGTSEKPHKEQEDDSVFRKIRKTHAHPLISRGFFGRLCRLAVLSLALFAIMKPIGADAHSELVDSEPKEGASVDSPVTEIALHFGEPVEKFITITLKDENGQTHAIQPPVIKEKNVTVTPKEPLEDGRYTLKWRLVSLDGHTVGDQLTFSVGSGAAPKDEASATTTKAKTAEKTKEQAGQGRTALFATAFILLAALVAIGFLSARRKKKA